jgi:O-antigen/teichoic acid export membrane protein
MSLKNLFVHTANYSIGNLLVTFSGFISFPILTRLFSVDQYGLLGLISSTLLILTGIAKLGTQHSIIRFFGEVKTGKRELSIQQFYTTVFLGMAGMGAAVTLLWGGLSQLIPPTWLNDGRLRSLFLLTSVLVFVRVIDSSLVNFLRAEQRTVLFNIYSVAKKYIGLAIIIVTLFFISRDLSGFYSATIVTEIVAVLILGTIILRGRGVSRDNFSPPFYREMLLFGIPMIGYEIAGIVLSVGDRYVIQAMIGGEALGIYSAAYNLCEYVSGIVIVAVGQAIMPIYMRLWAEQGEAETRKFLDQSLHYYLMVGIPILAGLSAVGPELLSTMASEKYRDGAEIIPYVMSGMLLDGTLAFFGASLFIHKQTKTIMLLVVASAVLNLVLNIILIPYYGIKGSAIATLISYCFLVLLADLASVRRLYIPIPWKSILTFGPISLIMYFAVIQISTGGQFTTLIAKIVVGTVIYIVFTPLIDERTRAIFMRGLAKAKRLYG